MPSATDREMGDVGLAIARRIASQAVWSSDACTWLVETRADGPGGVARDWQYARHDLYQGVAGIALCLAEAFGVTGDTELQRCAAGALRHGAAVAETLPPHHFGWCTGRVGLAYVLARFAQITKDQRWHDLTRSVLAPLFGEEGNDSQRDFIGGAAGAIPALLTIANWAELPEAADCAKRLGDYLLRVARRRPVCWSWEPCFPDVIDDLTGLSHGASGFGVALLELAFAFARGDFRYAAEQAFRYETLCFSTTARNWPDFRRWSRAADGKLVLDSQSRVTTPPPRQETFRHGFVSTWCHGAPGIGLARLRAFALTGEERFADEARVAIETTIDSLDPNQQELSGYSLCHGVFGNCETLLFGAAVLGAPRYRELAAKAAETAIEHFQAGPRSRADEKRDPGLFLGEAGSAHFLLRVAYGIPSALLLAPSSGNGQALFRGVVDEDGTPDTHTAQHCRREHVTAHLGLSTTAASYVPRLHDACERVIADLSDQAPVNTIRLLFSREEGEHLRDCFALECALMDLFTQPIDRFAFKFSCRSRPKLATSDLRSASFRIAAHVQIVNQRFDWRAWFDGGTEGLPNPAPTPISFAVFRRNDGDPGMLTMLEWERDWLSAGASAPINVRLARALAQQHGHGTASAEDFVLHAYRLGLVEHAETTPASGGIAAAPE